MFKWYASSEVCYVFLQDLDPQDHVDVVEPTSRFARCRWFLREWALQELIAPKIVEVYDRRWKFRGSKMDLRQAITTGTGIDSEVLNDSSILSTIPIARRMSWAAGRQTTRLEDLTYSLMSIFDINMPLPYGEGHGIACPTSGSLITKSRSWACQHLSNGRQLHDLPLLKRLENPSSESQVPPPVHRDIDVI